MAIWNWIVGNGEGFMDFHFPGKCIGKNYHLFCNPFSNLDTHFLNRNIILDTLGAEILDLIFCFYEYNLYISILNQKFMQTVFGWWGLS